MDPKNKDARTTDWLSLDPEPRDRKKDKKDRDEKGDSGSDTPPDYGSPPQM